MSSNNDRMRDIEPNEAYLTARDTLVKVEDMEPSAEAVAVTGVGWALVAVADELRRIGRRLPG